MRALPHQHACHGRARGFTARLRSRDLSRTAGALSGDSPRARAESVTQLGARHVRRACARDTRGGRRVAAEEDVLIIGSPRLRRARAPVPDLRRAETRGDPRSFADAYSEHPARATARDGRVREGAVRVDAAGSVVENLLGSTCGERAVDRARAALRRGLGPGAGGRGGRRARCRGRGVRRSHVRGLGARTDHCRRSQDENRPPAGESHVARVRRAPCVRLVRAC